MACLVAYGADLALQNLGTASGPMRSLALNGEMVPSSSLKTAACLARRGSNLRGAFSDAIFPILLPSPGEVALANCVPVKSDHYQSRR